MNLLSSSYYFIIFLLLEFHPLIFFWGGAGVFFDVRIYSRILNRIQMRMA